MPWGVLYRFQASPVTPGNSKRTAQRTKAGDITCVYTAQQCRNNPAPGSPHRILVVSDSGDVSEALHFASPKEEVVRTIQAREFLGGPLISFDVKELVEKWAYQVDETRLPLAARNQLQSVGRAVVTRAQFDAAVFDKRGTFPELLANKAGGR